MAKTVPVTTQLSETLNLGSEVQFTGGSVEAMDNKTPKAISRQSTALMQVQKATNALADQLNDAEAKQLYNEFYRELENNHNEYLEKEGLDAVASIQVEEGSEPKNTLDIYKNDNLQSLLNKYSSKATNGQVKYMFETRAGVSIGDSQNKMTQHSIKQQRLGLEGTLKDHLEITKREITDDYEKWNVPGSVYQTRKFVGMKLIDEIALLNDWNIDPEKGRVSSQYLKMRGEYLLEVSKSVVDRMRAEGVHPKVIQTYIDSYRGDIGDQTAEIMTEINEKEALVQNISKCVDATLRNNGNTNSGDFLSSSNRLLCLSSSNTFDDGKGAAVVDGHHSDEIDTNEKPQTENIEISEQIRNTSKFFSPESELNGTLIPQHQTTHLFAIHHLGVEKADSLYTKAKSELNIDPKQYKNNPVYAKNINEKIITNYKNLIIESAEKKYRPKINELKNSIANMEEKKSKMKSKGVYVQKRKDLEQKIKDKKLELQIAEENDPRFVEKIAVDLNALENEIDYDYDPSNDETVEIDSISGLQPLSVLEQKLRETITDPKELADALKDLKIKHNDITVSKNKLYTEGLNNAKTIAFARDGGWKDLKENNIDINSFKEKDQKILKNGQPENSDLDTLIMLNDNPKELKDNLNQYDYKLNKLDFIALQDYAASLDSKEKVIAVTVDNKMLELTLNKKGFSDLINNKAGSTDIVKTNYLEVQQEWKRLIDEEQIATDKKVSRDRKQQILNNLLDDKVFNGEYEGGFLGFGSKPVSQPRITLDDDQMEKAFVEINGDNIQLSSINGYIRAKITRKLEAKGMMPTAENIALYWVLAGRPTADNDYDYKIWNNKQMSSSQN